MKKVDVFSHDYILVPVHLGMHWCSCIINFKKKRIEYYDSLLGNNSQCFKLIRDYLGKEHQDKKKTPFDFSEWTDYAPTVFNLI